MVSLFWGVQGTFCVTGLLMILMTVELNDWGGNYGWAFLSALAQYSGMLCFGLVFELSCSPRTSASASGARGGRPPPGGVARRLHDLARRCWAQRRLIAPIALADIADVFLHAFGLNYAGPALYIVFFSSVTVWTALIRRMWLKRTLAPQQWCAVGALTVALAVTGAEHGGAGGEPAAKLVLGIALTLGAAVCDACMYVLTERALGAGKAGGGAAGVGGGGGPSPSEITVGVGALNLAASVLYVGCYSAAGRWQAWVPDQIRAKGGDPRAVVVGWAAMSFVMFLHYLSFYYSVGAASAVGAAVNKAVQSAATFLASAALYCNTSWGLGKAYPAAFVYDEKDCLTPLRGAAILVVCGSVLLYAHGYRQLKAGHSSGGGSSQLASKLLEGHDHARC